MGTITYSLREKLLIRLVEECQAYRDIKSKITDYESSAEWVADEKLKRGIIRGMSLFITGVWGNTYRQKYEVKELERWAMRTARELSSNNTDNADNGNNVDYVWWRTRFWRSDCDAGPMML